MFSVAWRVWRLSLSLVPVGRESLCMSPLDSTSPSLSQRSLLLWVSCCCVVNGKSRSPCKTVISVEYGAWGGRFFLFWIKIKENKMAFYNFSQNNSDLRHSFHRKQYDADTKWVSQVAKSIKDENPHVDISWSECIRLAEKYLRERIWFLIFLSQIVSVRLLCLFLLVIFYPPSVCPKSLSDKGLGWAGQPPRT